MDCLVAYYTEKFKNIDENNVFEMFSKFYESDLTLIYSWLEDQFKSKVVKNDSVSTVHRREGNAFYGKRNLLKSLEFYTKSLCLATPYSKEYGLALANRSAVSFEMKEYENCLKDINFCFKTDYPKTLMPKIYIRKAECHLELDQKENLAKAINDALDFLKNQDIPSSEKVKFIAKLNQIKDMKNVKKKNFFNDSFDEIPEFPDGESQTVASASSRIKMCYNQARGRHIVADADIKRGEILFIEKAFMFAPVFKDNQELCTFKCYHCLRDVISSMPCKSCTICIYCDEKCRDSSWKTCHKWECSGMQANIWFDLGIAFPALKVVLKSTQTKQPSLEGATCEDDVKKFGEKQDNYRYFNRLVSNIYMNKDVASYIVMSAMVISYLRKYTEFFPWYLKQPNCPKKNLKDLVVHVGGLMTKHTSQLVSNSSTIKHWVSSSAELLFPDDLVSVACGIFPSVSIMNHSCKPNVTNYFICDTIVVKALEDIPANEEIFNCYGIDYRTMGREQRQYVLKRLYHFDCKCSICSDSSKEIEMLDCYMCPKCKNLMPDTTSKSAFCSKCGKDYCLDMIKNLNKEAQRLEDDSNELQPQLQLHFLLNTIKIREKILNKYHKDFEEVYYKIYSYYVDHGDWENMFKYFHLWLENEKARRGANSRGIGTKLFEAALAILHCMQTSHPKNSTKIKAFLHNVENMIKEAKIILNLYYPDYITKRLSSKIHFISK